MTTTPQTLTEKTSARTAQIQAKLTNHGRIPLMGGLQTTGIHEVLAMMRELSETQNELARWIAAVEDRLDALGPDNSPDAPAPPATDQPQ